MEKFNLKKELKECLKTFLHDVWQMLCVGLVVAFLGLTQTEEQFKSIITLIIQKDWPIIVVIVIGIAYMSIVVEKSLKLIWWITKSIFKYVGCIVKKNNLKIKNP